ncbi:MAG: hypothetical protein HYR55_11270 [Acidobacteria bacterium]|nr:hypothetical protein [Acidobacteriota bacterium]MBI3658237.1 hypothetical protein [Acidobacteriota bacterium]
MKKQNSSFAIRGVPLILVLILTLVSGSAFAQNQTQFAYTANNTSFPSNNFKNISMVRTLDNLEVGTITVPTQPQSTGIAITDDDRFLYVTGTATSPDAVQRIDLLDPNPFPTTIRTGFARGAFYVAITPTPTGGGGCRYAFVTTGTDLVDVINDCTALLQTTLGLGASNTFGVTIANGGTEAWVTNAALNGTVYRINAATFTLIGPPITLPPGSFPGHIAYAYISPSEFRMYVTDQTPANRQVLVIPVINGEVQSVRSIAMPSVIDPVTGQVITNIGFMGIAVKPDNSKAYLTSNQDRWFFTINIPLDVGQVFGPYAQRIFESGRGVAWLTDGRAYIGNGGGFQNLLTVINNTNLSATLVILPSGRPNWIAPTNFTYNAAATRPLSTARVR